MRLLFLAAFAGLIEGGSAGAPLAPDACTEVKNAFPDASAGGGVLRAALAAGSLARAAKDGVQVPRVTRQATKARSAAGGRVGAAASVGVAISAGSDSGYLDALCFLAAFDEITAGAFGSNSNGRISVTTVSSGTNAYQAYVSGVDLATPELRDSWTPTELLAYPPPSEARTPFHGGQIANELYFVFPTPPSANLSKPVGQLIVDCVLDQAACDELANAPASVYDALAGAINARVHAPVYASGAALKASFEAQRDCYLEEHYFSCFLSGLFSTAGVPKDQFAPGPKPWWIQFSLLDYNDGPYFGTEPQGSMPALPIAGFESKLVLAALEQVPGRQSPRLVAGKRFQALLAQRTVGASTRTLSGGKGFLQDVLENTVQSEAVKPLDSWSALVYSADFVQQRQGFVRKATAFDDNGLGPQTCPFPLGPQEPAPTAALCSQAAVIRDLTVADSSLLGSFSGSTTQTAQATDGALTDVSGVISLLQSGVRNIILLWTLNVPWASAPALSPLWGVDLPVDDLCINPAAALGAAKMQVFANDAGQFNAVFAGLANTAGPGFVHLTNVPVLDNHYYDIDGYTLDNLIIFSNGNIDSFGASLTNYDAIQASFSPGWPESLPFLTTTSYDAMGKCLLAKHKVANAQETLLSVLNPALEQQ